MMRIVGILVTTMCLGILFLLLLLLMLWWSPYNVDSARTVFVIPLFTTLECHALKKQLDTIIVQSIQQEQQPQQQEDVVSTTTTTTNKAWQHAANNKNMNATTQTLLEFPLGWPHKLQFQSMPTTTTGWNNSFHDNNNNKKNKMTISYFHWHEFMNHLRQSAQTTSSNVDDNDDNNNHNKNNNNKKDNDLEQLLNARLAPTLELLYGIPAKYWRLVRNNNEILVRMVRYDVSPLPQVNNTTRTRIRTTSQPQSLSSSQQQEQQHLPLWQEEEEDEEGNNELQNFASPFVDVIATLESTVNLIQFRIILTPTAATTTRTTNHPVGSDASAAPSTEEKDGTITVIDKTTTTTTSSSNSNNKTLLLSTKTTTTRTQYWNRWTRQPLGFDEMTTTMTNVVDIPSPPALSVGSLVVHSTQVPHKEQVVEVVVVDDDNDDDVTMHYSTNERDSTTTTRSPKQQEGQQQEQEEPRIELVGYVTWKLPRNWRRNSHILNTTTSHNNNDDNNNNNDMMISSFLVSWLGSIIPSCWYATWFSVNWWTHVLQQQSIVSPSWSLQQQEQQEQRKSGIATRTTTHRHGRRYYSNLENDDQDKRLREIFAFLSRAVQTLGDALLPHRIRTLVPHHYHYRYHHHQHANNAYLMEFDQTMALEQQQQQTRQQQSLSLFDKWNSWDDEQKQQQKQRDSMTTCLSRGGEENHDNNNNNQDYCYYNEPHDGSSSSLSSLPQQQEEQQQEQEQQEQQRCMADPYDPVAWKPGDLNQMFERIVATYNETVHVWSRPSDNSHGRGNIAVDKNKNNKEEEEVATRTTTRDGPWIITIDDFITNAEAKQFIQWGYTNGFERSQGVVATSKEEAGSASTSSSSSGVVSADRTSSNTWCHEGCQDDAIIVAVQKRLEEMTQIPMEHAEAIQLLQCKCFLLCVYVCVFVVVFVCVLVGRTCLCVLNVFFVCVVHGDICMYHSHYVRLTQ